MVHDLSLKKVFAIWFFICYKYNKDPLSKVVKAGRRSMNNYLCIIHKMRSKSLKVGATKYF